MPITNATDLSRVPLRQPPPGQQPNFINPESRAYQSQATFGVCIFLAVLFVGLRIHRRLIGKIEWGWDDWFCVAATLAFLAFGACRLSWMEPWGARLWDTPASLAKNERLSKQWLAEGALYVVATMLVKISILLLYLRLFNINATTRRLVYGGAVAITLFYTPFLALQLALCHPRRGEDPYGASLTPRCTGTWKLRYYSFSAFNIASDVYIVALPLPVVWCLQMDRRRKVAVTAVLVMGLLACVCAVLRVVYAQPSIAAEDENWEVIQNNCIGYSELTLGIVCCCLPVVWETLKRSWDGIATRLRTSWRQPAPPSAPTELQLQRRSAPCPSNGRSSCDSSAAEKGCGSDTGRGCDDDICGKRAATS